MTRTKFINRARFDYGRFERITFTRSRPYRKNDRAHVEQKNGAIVRALVGYDRYASRAAYAQLARVYPLLRLHTNFFQPVQRLVAKSRHGARVTRRYCPDTVSTLAGRRHAGAIATARTRRAL